jgi:putative ABC transport system permease protein
MLWSVNLKIMGAALDKTSAANLPLSARNYKLLISMLHMSSSILVLVILAVALIAVLYWFFGTEYGSTLRATGNNAEMSRAQGINTGAVKIVGLVISNGLVALSGALLAQYQGNADINMGKGAIVIGLAAVIIGEALFGWLTKNNFALKLLSVIFGGIIYFIVYSTVIYIGLDTNYLKMLSAFVVALFLAVPYWKKEYFGRGSRRKSGKNNGKESG